MSSSFPYQTTVEPYGIPAYSNIPFDQPAPSPASYQIDVNFSIPVAQLADVGFNAANALGGLGNAIIAQGYTGTISNVQASVPSPSTLRVNFMASSPGPLIVILAIMSLAAIVAALILSITMTVGQTLGSSGPLVGYVIAGVVAVAVGAYVYSFFRSSQVRHETARIFGGTLSSGRGGVQAVRGASAKLHRATHLDEVSGG